VTNAEAFTVLRPLVDDGTLKLETGGTLRQGRDAWLMGRWDLARFGRLARETFADELAAYTAVLANHSGRRGLLIGNTPIRIVCANTLGQAETEGRSRWQIVYHSGGAKGRLAEVARELFGNVVERYEVMARHYAAMQARRLSEDEFGKLVLDVIAPDPRKHPKFNVEAATAEGVVERAMKKRDEVRRLWFAGRGHTGEPTAWYAYNGAVEALDHNRELWPTRAGAWRTASLIDGTLAEMKNKVLDNLAAASLTTAALAA
jgi:phage/plasmid-like protein (TIGR03299 family)